MPSRFTIPTPDDFILSRDACSYGYFVLAPNHWSPTRNTLTRVLHLADGPARVTLAQDDPSPSPDPRRTHDPDGVYRPHFPGSPGAPLRVSSERTLSAAEKAQARRQITRMLRLDEGPEAIAEFHAADPRWAPSGRGRLFRSPTLFEDVVKTVTSCNVAWPSTVAMNLRLCEVLGGRAGDPDAAGERALLPTHAFPPSGKVARTRPSTLRARCRVGYRDARIVELARLFTPRGRRPPELDPAWFEDPSTPTDAIHARLLELPGVGPYAAANILQLLGRYERLPLDTETVRHARSVLGMQGTDAQLMRRVAEHFAPLGRHAFRGYWFELWTFYERKHGPAHTWERRTTATAFTAAKLNAG